jgi:hypothetical protein
MGESAEMGNLQPDNHSVVMENLQAGGHPGDVGGLQAEGHPGEVGGSPPEGDDVTEVIEHLSPAVVELVTPYLDDDEELSPAAVVEVINSGRLPWAHLMALQQLAGEGSTTFQAVTLHTVCPNDGKPARVVWDPEDEYTAVLALGAIGLPPNRIKEEASSSASSTPVMRKSA